MNWTKAQEQAISQRDKNIIVSAAAGSGKTAVLVERIRRIVVDEGVPVDRLLVVTFTNAAASEMKEKIKISLEKEMEDHPEKASLIKEQLNRLPMSYISTFHSFALRVIRRFFYLTDVEANFKICDEERKHLLKAECIEEVIESALASEDEAVLNLFDCYSSHKNFENIKELINFIYMNVIAHPDKFKMLDVFISALYADKDTIADTPMAAYFKKLVMNLLKEAENSCMGAIAILENFELKRLAEKIKEGDLSVIKGLQEEENLFSSFDKIREILIGYKAVSLRASKEEKVVYESVKLAVKSYRDAAKEYLTNLLENFFYESLEVVIKQMNATAESAKVLSALVQHFDDLFSKYKKKLHVLDFNDIEHKCLEILRTEEAQEYYRDKFEYILVDEFQDTNLLQDEIINCIKRKDNLFMVGDVKQSIYKFRLAEPEIFQKKYEQYLADESEDCCAIDLNKNYRSKASVLDAVNNLFYSIMPGYDERAALYCGLTYDGSCSYSPVFDILDLSKKSEEDEDYDESSLLISALSNTEAEAAHVANILRAYIGKPFFDSKTGNIRSLEPKDVVLLLRNVKRKAPIYYNAVKNAGIDIMIDDIGGYFENIEIDLFINLLNIIDNKKQDIPLISVLHSDIFGFTAAELGEIRATNMLGKFYDAFIGYSEGDDMLAERCRYVLSCLNEWKKISKVIPLDDFLWKVMVDTGHYLTMGAMPMGYQRQMNLRLMVEKAKEYTKSNQSGLYGFLDYLKKLRMRKFDLPQSKGSDDSENCVRIMTIHKSKGLEFPMVIISGMESRLKYTNDNKGVIFQKDVGLGLTYVNKEECWKKKTLISSVIKNAINDDEVNEEKRILYVAMTRARDILYMVGSTRSTKSIKKNVANKIATNTSYQSMMLPYVPFRIVNLDLDAAVLGECELSDQVSEEEITGDEIYENICDDNLKEKILNRLNFDYPYNFARGLKSKYSVSELNKKILIETMN